VRIDDPAHVARQYATEENLEARRALYADATGPDPREITRGSSPLGSRVSSDARS